MDFEAAIRQLQEVDIVSAAIQSRHEERLKAHREWLENQARWMTAHAQAMAEFDKRLLLFEEQHNASWKKHDEKMIEIEDKLDGLISVVDDIVRHRKNGQSQ